MGHVITMPGFPLPQGWNKDACRVCFVAPQGYPYAKPDSFWTDEDLRLLPDMRVPKNTQKNQGGPGLAEMLWFSWHTEHWNASRDDLLSWVASIRDRLSRLS